MPHAHDRDEQPYLLSPLQLAEADRECRHSPSWAREAEGGVSRPPQCLQGLTSRSAWSRKRFLGEPAHPWPLRDPHAEAGGLSSPHTFPPSHEDVDVTTYVGAPLVKVEFPQPDRPQVGGRRSAVRGLSPGSRREMLNFMNS